MEDSEDFTIRLTVWEHTFFVTVKRKEEEIYRAAAKTLDSQYNKMIAQYPGQSPSTYMCMAALAVAVLWQKEAARNDTRPLVEGMKRILTTLGADAEAKAQ